MMPDVCEYSICEREKHIENPSKRITLFEALMIASAAVIFIACFASALVGTDRYLDMQSRHGSYGFISSEQPDVSAINSADREELMKISGIGDKRAELIMDFRDAMGGFTDVRQIMYLDGIGEKLFSNILEHFYSGCRIENESIVKAR